MGTFQATHPLISEDDKDASVPYFSWLNFLSPGRTILNPFQINPEVGVGDVPISPGFPANQAAKNDSFKSQPIHNKKQKIPQKASDHIAPKTIFKQKHTSKNPEKSKKMKASNTPAAKRERKNSNFMVYETGLDISGVPAPVCTCTGVPRQCYRGGSGGWQSSCCTINISQYPLPMSSTRPSSRMAGRKMSHGAFEKLLQRLAAEGHDLSCPIDLKEHWARHGTNKFVIIK
ncbi:hypothetical protein Nepgr_024422 [Nepenthes gracilis]|uniref:GAGA-binding transcriptional activator n=1 Tax=Nepenthes gracilis TaxID=150966 RepID=A0AAD3T561_NEPGR|nr:hypothetical protein Nepgr_024422 [Nepenthes gracilis]